MWLFIGAIVIVAILVAFALVLSGQQQNQPEDNQENNDNANNNDSISLRTLYFLIIGGLILIGLAGAHEFQLFGKLSNISHRFASVQSGITTNSQKIDNVKNAVVNSHESLSKSISDLEQETKNRFNQLDKSVEKTYKKADENRKNQRENYYLLSGKLSQNRQALDSIPTNVQRQIDKAIKNFQSRTKTKTNKDLLGLLKRNTDLNEKSIRILNQLDTTDQEIVDTLSSMKREQPKDTSLEDRIGKVIAGQEDMKENQNKILEGQKATQEQIQDATQTIEDKIDEFLGPPKQGPPAP